MFQYWTEDTPAARVYSFHLVWLFYEAMQFVNRTTNVAANVNQFTNGEYRNFAHLAGMSIRFIFGPQ